MNKQHFRAWHRAWSQHDHAARVKSDVYEMFGSGTVCAQVRPDGLVGFAAVPRVEPIAVSYPFHPDTAEKMSAMFIARLDELYAIGGLA